ncbi:inositol monophosphatase [Gregarina niphandrodes]|uniref:Inositol-1-monophosphatase n=1 Tax=Gregarina niphandrodes TaxID=110365 RepID=A0A023B8Z2_GRENI|nr:inositol monophosphatase [Gregarina niphandrodes]EZG70697.1 inositol monophosphatase [Gregarina niphandrodes]|eukprot:XP_011129880.1 inositol monophosphatase [Gregarina niphandrodes]
MMVERTWIETLARKVGDVIREDGTRAKHVSEKMSISDLVTESDVKVEKMIRSAISTAFPDHKFFGEETTHEELTDDPTWVVDPIDGTSNFVHTFPLHSVSIAYCERKVPVIGVIYVPCRDEMFSAERGKGSFLNGKQISVTKRQVLQECIVSTGFHVGFLKKLRTLKQTKGENDETVKRLSQLRNVIYQNTEWLLENAQDIRRTGACSVDMCYVACGRLDAFAEIGPHEWDFAAGKIIVEEAGGFIKGFGRDFDLGNREVIVANTNEIAELLSSNLLPSPLDISEF